MNFVEEHFSTGNVRKMIKKFQYQYFSRFNDNNTNYLHSVKYKANDTDVYRQGQYRVFIQ